MRTHTFIAVAIVLAACGSSMQSGTGGDITLSAAATAAGDSIVLTLANRSVREVGYNLCASGIERQTAGGWETVRTDRACTMELRVLQAGAETRYHTALPPGTTSGDYRFHTTVELMADRDRRAVRSNVVRVTP